MLDESTRYHLQYGGDPEGDDGVANGNGHSEQLSRRKKAPVRRRRRAAGADGGGTNGAGREVG